jgi:ribosomal-protein-alanine N-acetyltransferase
MRRLGSRDRGAGPATADAEGGGSGLQVRALTYADLPAVLAIERRSFTTPWSLAMFVLELSKPSGICLAASVDRRLAGYLVCSRYADVWHLMNVAIAPEHRRRGIATSLLRRMVETAGTQARYTLEVRTSNRPAIAMYEQLGFRPAGHRRGYYHDNGEDALIMWLEPEQIPAVYSAPA